MRRPVANRVGTGRPPVAGMSAWAWGVTISDLFYAIVSCLMDAIGMLHAGGDEQ